MGILPLTTATTITPLPPLSSYSGIPAPTNVASGTITNGCGYYYVVNPGDNCTAVEELFVFFNDQKEYNLNYYLQLRHVGFRFSKLQRESFCSLPFFNSRLGSMCPGP